MKKLLPIGLIALISFGAAAIPAKKGVRTYKQTDGTTISLNLVGDENFHSFVTADGLTVSKAEDGNFYYQTTSGISNILAHNVEHRSANEISFINANIAEMSVSSLFKANVAKGTARKAPKRGAVRKASQVPSTGSPRVPVILVQYSDYKFKDSDPVATFKSYFSEGNTSAYQYFKDQSNGKYTPQFDLYGPVTLTKTRATYGGNDYYGNDKGVGKMVGEACNLINEELDFSLYDNDKDGECDVVIVLYAGDGEASSYDDDAEDSVWPCQWELSESDYGKSLTLDATKVDKFAVFNELFGSDLSKIDGIGTFCHEFSHCLDLPDYYDTNYGAHFGMGPWSLMDYGSYNDDGYTPIGYSAYEKEFMGWISIEEGKEDTFYSLPVFNQKNVETDKAVKITNPKDVNEYYILENRAQQGWDKYMPHEGMLITHVTYSASAWANNTVNNEDLQRITPLPADGNLKLDKTTYYGQTYYSFNEEDLAGDLWPYGDATELTDTSKPAAKVNTGGYMGKPITEITKTDDGNVSFWVMKTPLPAVATPINVAHALTSATSATITWEAADAIDVTYTLEVSKHQNYELVLSTDFSNSNTWTEDGSVNNNGGVYIGSSKRTGSLTSPAFTTNDEGVVTVVLNAKSYGTDASSVKVSLLDASEKELDSETFALTTDYANYVAVFNGNSDATAYVKIESIASKKRVYVNTADIYNGDASNVTSNDARARAASANKMTITGILETSYTISDLEENGTYDYRVKAVPVNVEENSASAWSEKYQFSLSEYTAVSAIETVNTDAQAEYFTLQGIRVAGTPSAPGLYIRRQGNQTTKVIVK